jgi:hypothetical protein
MTGGEYAARGSVTALGKSGEVRWDFFPQPYFTISETWFLLLRNTLYPQRLALTSPTAAVARSV